MKTRDEALDEAALVYARVLQRLEAEMQWSRDPEVDRQAA